MKIYAILLAFIIIINTGNLIAQNKCDSLEIVSWMLGEWVSENSSSVTVENWEKVSEHSFEGFGKTKSADSDKVKSYESLRLVEMSGQIYFIAKVGHNELPIAFALTTCSDSMAVFENPDHDFPKKIDYKLQSHDRISVTVSSGDDGFRIEFAKKLLD